MTTTSTYFRWTTLLPLIAFSAQATAIIQESIEQMARRCPTVIRGTVESQKVQWDANRKNIETLTLIRVTDSIKGRVGSRISVRTLGGELDGVGQRVIGAPVFRTGEDVVLFLENVRNSPFFQVAGLAAGKISIEETALGRQAVRRLEGLEQYRPSAPGAGPIQLIDKEELGSPDTLLRRIRRAISSEREPR